MKNFILLLCLIFCSTLTYANKYDSSNGSWGCITHISSDLAGLETTSEFVFFNELIAGHYNDEGFFMKASSGLRCQSFKDKGTRALSVLGITAGAGAIALACTGAGAPLGLFLRGVALSSAAMTYYIGGLECASTEPEVVEPLVIQSSCEMFLSMGFECNPYEVELSYTPIYY